MGKEEDSNKIAHNETSHQALHCLQKHCERVIAFTVWIVLQIGSQEIAVILRYART